MTTSIQYIAFVFLSLLAAHAYACQYPEIQTLASRNLEIESDQLKIVRQLETKFEMHSMEVVDTKTDLTGLRIVGTVRRGRPLPKNSVKLGELNIFQVNHELDSNFYRSLRPVSETFFISEDYNRPMQVRFATNNLPKGCAMRDVRLYRYSQVVGIDEWLWVASVRNWNIEQQYGYDDLVVNLTRLGGAYFLGVTDCQHWGNQSLETL